MPELPRYFTWYWVLYLDQISSRRECHDVGMGFSDSLVLPIGLSAYRCVLFDRVAPIAFSILITRGYLMFCSSMRVGSTLFTSETKICRQRMVLSGLGQNRSGLAALLVLAQVIKSSNATSDESWLAGEFKYTTQTDHAPLHI
jgi:hypothetical protein